MRILLICLLLFPSLLVAEPITQQDTLLNHVIRQQLTRYHFDRRNRPLDDEFSKDAFELFLKRIDGQKRLLLQSDVDRFRSLETALDDNFKSGKIHLPAMAEEALNHNLAKLKPFVEDLLSRPFDYDQKESFETDPEKLTFCESIMALQDRWRRHLKYQTLNSYLSSKDSEKAKLESSGNTAVLSDERMEELREKAREKTAKQLTSYFERMEEMEHKDHMTRYFNAITTSFDPHTTYMDPQAKEDFTIRMSKSLQGIGAVLQEEDDFTKVLRIVPGSASYRQGDLKAGDTILRVAEGEDGEEIDITGMALREVVGYIRGEKGTTVRLTVKKPNGDVTVIAIVRDIVELEDAVAKSTLLEAEGKRIGYIYLPDFYRDAKNPALKNCTADVKAEVIQLMKDKIDGLIFDLRGNGGGFLEDARTIAGLFIERGPIVQVKDSFGRVNVLYDDDRRVVYDGPLIVMVDQFSASASEIVSAALQDYGRAVIVGSGKTHGKGTVQHLVSLNRQLPNQWKDADLGDLKLTIQKFYRINGGSTQHRGVEPDIVLPDDKTYMESGERHLDYALAWDSISQLDYRPWKGELPIQELTNRSEKRVKDNPIFQAISARGERLKTRYDDTVVILSPEAMIAERKENKEEAERYKELLKELKERVQPGSTEAAEEEVEEVSNDEKTPEQIREEEHQEWAENVRFDPHVRESLHIMKDLMALTRPQKS